MREDRRKARAALASAAARASKDPTSTGLAANVDTKRRDYWAIALEDHIREVVAKAPPLSTEQRDRLATLLRSGDAA